MPKKPIDYNAGKRLSEVRRHREMSQRELAKAINVKAGTIQGYEHARIGISATRLEQLAHGLQCETADLLMPPESPLPRYSLSAAGSKASAVCSHEGLLFTGVSDPATTRSRSWRSGE